MGVSLRSAISKRLHLCRQRNVGLYIGLIFLLTLFSNAQAQEADSLPSGNNPEFSSMINMSRDLSYLTFTQGLGDLEPLLFEAKISPSFFFSHKKADWAIELNTAILIRMLNKESFPIRTPSYMPAIHFHKRIKKWETSIGQKLFYDNAFWTASLRHHSNGQEDSFYNEDSTAVNTNSGNFSTNYLEFGITSFSFFQQKGQKKYKSVKAHVEYHPSWPFKWYMRELEDRYGRLRFYFTYNTFNLPELIKEGNKSNFLKRSRIRLKSGWIFGELGGASEVDISERLMFESTYIYHPKWLDEVALFVQFYHGQDYYNIHFEETIDILRIGIISDPLDFMNVNQIFK